MSPLRQLQLNGQPQVRSARLLTPYRMQLTGDRTREAIRLELMLEDARFSELNDLARVRCSWVRPT